MDPAPLIFVTDQEAVRLNEQARQAIASNRLAEGCRLLQDALRRDPRYLPAWLNLAAAQRAEGDLAAALDSVASALKLQPLHYPALLLRGILLEAMGQTRKAGDAYAIALTQLPPPDRLDEAMRRATSHAIAIHKQSLLELENFFDRELRPEIGLGSSAARRRMDQFVDHLAGKRRPFWQAPTNFFYPGLASIEFHDRDDFPWLPMVEAATDRVCDELIAVLRDEQAQRELEPYMQRPVDEPVEQWGELNFSPRWSAYHFALYGKIYHEHRQACPYTAALLDQMPIPVIQNRMPAALFSILQPKTHIPAHNGAGNIRLLCHLPLILPPHCRFRVGNSIREWRMGEAFVFDDTIEHEAWNDSDQLRAVLIFDIWNPALSENERNFITHALTSLDRFSEQE
jgi:aspartyl/asparaginyl beta-hydroxylase (cupin superfamily)